MRTTITAVILGAFAIVANACGMLPPELQPADPLAVGAEPGLLYPGGCDAFGLSARRCAFIVERLAASEQVDTSRVSEIRLLGDPGCGPTDPGQLCTRTTTFVVRVRYHFADRQPVEASQFCGIGGDFDLACTDEPRIGRSSPTEAGYHDVPCSGEPPDGCATPVPTIDPDALAGARPLEVASLDIPLDHVGAYDIPLGTAVLPNGVLTESTFALADDIQRTFLLEDGTVRLAVIDSAGKPLFNIYATGWQADNETVEVRLQFTVIEADPGAAIGVRDVVVR